MMQLREAVKLYIERLIITSDPLYPEWNTESRLFKKQPKWNYMDSCVISALLRYYELSRDERLLSYASVFMETYVDENGNIPTMHPEDYNLDNLCGGRVLLSLHRKTGDKRYLAAAEMLMKKQVENQPRTACGSFWHKAVYPHQVWLDGTYMAFPFMAEYAKMTGKTGLIDDILSQLETIRRVMCDAETGLYYHGYDDKRMQPWADPETGLSREFWLRSMGWLCAGLADLCELIPHNELTETMLGELLASLEKYTLDDGMLMQLPARGELAGNYPETSGTLLFAYSALKAYRMRIVSSQIRDAGKKALFTVAEKYITPDESGLPVLGNICLTAGLGGERDGSAEYYLSEKITENEAKGIAPLLQAYMESGIRSA